MIKTLTSFLTKQRTLHAELKLDHIELSREQLILGLQLTWHNDTPNPMEIRAVVIQLFHKGKKETPLELVYNGRFVRIPFQKTITKIAGATSFHIKPGATQVESLRFLTRDIFDLNEGNYPVELHSTVPDGTYFHNFDLQVTSQLKYRMPGPESEKSATGTTTSSIYVRALRITS